MDLRDYLRITARYWWVAVLFLVIGLVGGFGWFLIKPATYQSCATLFASTDGGSSVGEAYQNNLFGQERVKSYAQLATSSTVINRTAQQLRAQPGDIAGAITAAPVTDTVLFTICADDADPGNAQTIANAVAVQVTQLVQELETSARAGIPSASVNLVSQAATGARLSPQLVKSLLFGGAGGLALGVVAMILIGLGDRRVRDRAKVEESTGHTVLASLPVSKTRPSQAALDLSGSDPLVEPIRSLATTVRFLGAGDPPKVIALTAPSDSVGKTTVAIDLAAALADAGHSVVLVGADLRNTDLGDRLNIAGGDGLSAVLAGQASVADVVVESGAFAVVPPGPAPHNPAELLASQLLPQLYTTLRKTYDYVIVDTPGLAAVSDGAVLAALADGTILLGRNKFSGRAELAEAVRLLDTVHANILGAVLTFDAARTKSAKATPAKAPQAAETSDDTKSVAVED